MGKIIDFYKGLSKERKIVFWVCIGVIFLSILGGSLRTAKRKNIPTAKGFIKQIKSEKKPEKIYGIYSAGVNKINEALPLIEEIFNKEKDPQIKRVCAWSMGQIDFNKLLSYLDTDDKATKEIVFETLLKIDKKNIQYIINRFDKEDEETKLKILSYMADPKYEDKLMKIAEDEKEPISVRKQSLEILKKVGTSSIEARLLSLYYNEENEEIKNLSYETMKEIQKRGGK